MSDHQATVVQVDPAAVVLVGLEVVVQGDLASYKSHNNVCGSGSCSAGRFGHIQVT